MTNDPISAKREEIAKSLASMTGVAQKDVEKVLESLGLTGALKHRQYVSESAHRLGLADLAGCSGGGGLRGGDALGARRLNNVNLYSIRIAAGQIVM